MPVRKSPIASLLCLFLLCVAAPIAMSSAGCTAAQRRDTLKASLSGVDAARSGFTTWDASHQQQLVSESTSLSAGQDALKAYRASRDKVKDGFEVAYQALAVAATQTDDLSLQAALARANEVVAAVKALIGDF